MEANSTQQEILLITGTSFTSGFFCKTDDPQNSKGLSEKERLEEACWNGLIRTMLPEIFLKTPDGSALFLWQIREAASFLELAFSEAPAVIDRYFSITPYSFLSTQSYC
jgi:hypothetical protein